MTMKLLFIHEPLWCVLSFLISFLVFPEINNCLYFLFVSFSSYLSLIFSFNLLVLFFLSMENFLLECYVFLFQSF